MTTWQVNALDFPHEGDSIEKLAFLLRYAILAPSSHNSQPWKFRVSEDEVRVYVDHDRWLQIADPDRRELHVSAGCALENLLVAAEHFGYGHQVNYFPNSEDQALVAAVKFAIQGQPSSKRNSDLFEGILRRHTNRKPYDGNPIALETRLRLEARCVEEGVRLHWLDDLAAKQEIERLILRADRIQFADHAYRAELGYWIGQGLLGTPVAISRVLQWAVKHFNLGWWVAKTDSRLVMSAPLRVVISSELDDRVSQVKTGQVFERVGLLAAVLNVRVHPMSQILQIPELKQEARKLLPGSAVIPQHIFRVGYAQAERGRRSRRSVGDVIQK